MRRVILLALVGLSLMGYSLYRRSVRSNQAAVASATQATSGVTAQAQANAASTQVKSAAQKVGIGSVQPAQQSVSAPSASEKAKIEKRSLDQMVHILAEFSKTDRSLSDLVKLLKDSKQDPTLSRSSNPYTGSMTIVRTNSPLPGTRYFHAQYLSDDETSAFVQHMSFEYKPGTQSMAEVIQAVKSILGPDAHLRKNKEDFKQWVRDDGYVLWIKRMGAEDLEENPNNAYSKKDEGTIRVALEIDEEHDEH